MVFKLPKQLGEFMRLLFFYGRSVYVNTMWTYSNVLNKFKTITVLQVSCFLLSKGITFFNHVSLNVPTDGYGHVICMPDIAVSRVHWSPMAAAPVSGELRTTQVIEIGEKVEWWRHVETGSYRDRYMRDATLMYQSVWIPTVISSSCGTASLGSHILCHH